MRLRVAKKVVRKHAWVPSTWFYGRRGTYFLANRLVCRSWERHKSDGRRKKWRPELKPRALEREDRRADRMRKGFSQKLALVIQCLWPKQPGRGATRK